jgi:hypothetical protein
LPTLIHGDLGPEHLRVRNGRLVGVIGPWYGAHYGVLTSQPAFVERGLAKISARL